MKTLVSKPPHPLTWLVGGAVILFCLVGIAAFMGWLPPSPGSVVAESIVAKPELAPVPAPEPVQASAIAPQKKKVHAPVAERPVARSEPMRTGCGNCAVVDSIRVIDVAGDSSMLGTVGGALVGGVLGHQVGRGRGNDLATVAGAVGGAVAGNAIEKRAKATRRYETTVRFEDGSTRVFGDAREPQWHNGDRVKVVDGTILLRD